MEPLSIVGRLMGGSDPIHLPRALDYLQSEGTTVLSKAHEVENIKRAILIEHSDSGSISLINAGSDAVNSIVL